jgi:hypothetical protein
MIMDKDEAQLHRTWVQLLVDHGYREIAAIAIDTEVKILYAGPTSRYDYYYSGDPSPYGIAFDFPTSVYSTVIKDDQIKEVMEHSIAAVCKGRYFGDEEHIEYNYRVKLIEVEEDWQNIVRSLITTPGDSNQGVITERVFLRKGKQPYTYNEMKFGSQTEIRIAQEFESRGILFFPLPLAVRTESGSFYKDHREPDFLVCEDGTWGILEVSHHPDRYEKDAEKDAWFKKSGILCIEHYTAERCYKNPAQVVDEFLAILAKHKR